MENTTKTNEVLVNKVEGNIVSDSLIKEVVKTDSSRLEDAKKIGKLEGQVMALEADLAREAYNQKNPEKEVQVCIRHIDDNPQNIVLDRNPWDTSWTTTYGNRKQHSYIDKVTSISIDNLSTLVNNAVKDEAAQLVAEADKEIEATKKEMEKIKKVAEGDKKYVDSLLKKVREDYKKIDDRIAEGVKKAEKKNLDEISELNLKIQTLNKQIEANDRELDFVREERNLIVESLNVQIDMLNKRLEIAKISVNDLFKRIRKEFQTWRYSRKLKVNA